VLNAAAIKIVQIARRIPGMRLRFYPELRDAIVGKSGLEIGGPSGVFSDGGILPVYRHVKALDNVVFSEKTVWEGTREEGRTYVFHKHKPTGVNYITEAVDLRGIPNNAYDFLLAAHCLEHIANPIKALHEWQRVLKPGAQAVVVLPNYRKTFDHRRRPTAVNHMVDDYRNNVGEDDLTHLPEILELHDLRRDRGAGTFGEFKARALNNTEYRCLHHHVFDKDNSRELLEKVGLRVWAVETALPHHIALAADCRPGLAANVFRVDGSW